MDEPNHILGYKEKTKYCCCEHPDEPICNWIKEQRKLICQKCIDESSMLSNLSTFQDIESEDLDNHVDFIESNLVKIKECVDANLD